MIRINELTEKDVGRWVIGTNDELGRIKSWNKRYVFVVYNCDGNWDKYQDYTAEATLPSELQFVTN